MLRWGLDVDLRIDLILLEPVLGTGAKIHLYLCDIILLSRDVRYLKKFGWGRLQPDFMAEYAQMTLAWSVIRTQVPFLRNRWVPGLWLGWAPWFPVCPHTFLSLNFLGFTGWMLWSAQGILIDDAKEAAICIQVFRCLLLWYKARCCSVFQWI